MKAGIFAVLLVIPTVSWGWSDHFRVTGAALQSAQDLRTRMVFPTPFDAMVAALGYPGADAFNRAIQINKNYRFKFRLGERLGEPISVLEVLKKYSDEPDWKMDQELFSQDQYPKLWRLRYLAMGGRHGIPSQAFRHMYWVFDPLHLWNSAKIPHFYGPQGEAPRRAALFVHLSEQARAAGEKYWSTRFLACALHYLEDVAQPYHSTQMPEKNFLFYIFRKNGSVFHSQILQITKVIAYYHFSFESYTAWLMGLAEAPVPDPDGEKLVSTLANDPAVLDHGIAENAGQIDSLVRAMADFSMKRAPRAAAASVRFFPPLTQSLITVNLADFMNADWWKTVTTSPDSEARLNYLTVVHSVFSQLGYALRATVERELGTLDTLH